MDERDEVYTCDNCLYRDDCDTEYKQEQPNWCENWESENW